MNKDDERAAIAQSGEPAGSVNWFWISLDGDHEDSAGESKTLQERYAERWGDSPPSAMW